MYICRQIDVDRFVMLATTGKNAKIIKPKAVRHDFSSTVSILTYNLIN